LSGFLVDGDRFKRRSLRIQSLGHGRGSFPRSAKHDVVLGVLKSSGSDRPSTRKPTKVGT
jgi:hypothetical protein